MACATPRPDQPGISLRSCPPTEGLQPSVSSLTSLRETPGRSGPAGFWLARSPPHLSSRRAGVRAKAKSRRSPRRAGDMSGGMHPSPSAGTCKKRPQKALASQATLAKPVLLGSRRLDHVLHRRFRRHFVVVPELADDIFQGAGLGRLERHILGNGRNQAT